MSPTFARTDNQLIYILAYSYNGIIDSGHARLIARETHVRNIRVNYCPRADRSSGQGYIVVELIRPVCVGINAKDVNNLVTQH